MDVLDEDKQQVDVPEEEEEDKQQVDNLELEEEDIHKVAAHKLVAAAVQPEEELAG